MIVQLVDEEGTIIGTTDITAIRMKTTSSPTTTIAPRHMDRWTEFENDSLHQSFDDYVRNRAMKQGRTEGAILSRLWRFMPSKVVY